MSYNPTSRGIASGTTDVNGYLTVTHGLGYTPSQVFVTSYPAGAYTSNAVIAPAVDAITATTFRVRLATAVSAGSGNWYLSWISNPTRFFWQAFR